MSQIGRVGELLTTALDAGADSIQGVSLAVSDREALRHAALREAVGMAEAEARVVAAATGLRLTGVRSVVTDPLQPPGVPVSAVVGAGDAVAIAPGENTIAARVQMTFDVAPTGTTGTTAPTSAATPTAGGRATSGGGQ